MFWVGSVALGLTQLLVKEYALRIKVVVQVYDDSMGECIYRLHPRRRRRLLSHIFPCGFYAAEYYVDCYPHDAWVSAASTDGACYPLLPMLS